MPKRYVLMVSLLAISISTHFTGPLSAQALYAITGAGSVESFLYRIDPTSGTVLQKIGDLGTTHVTALAFSPVTGLLYGHISNAPTSDQLILINPDTAAFSVIGATGHQVPDMNFRTDGTLFAWSKNNQVGTLTDDLYRINVSTAQATLVGEAGYTSTMVGLSFAPNGTLYMKDANSLNTIDPTTGVPTFVMNFTGLNLANALAFDSAGKALSINRNGVHSNLMTFDMNTGTVTTIGEILDQGQPVTGIAALAFQPSAIPEPTTIALAAIGIAGVWSCRRLRRARK